jgi:hypothetical protein
VNVAKLLRVVAEFAWYMLDRWGARVSAQHFRVELEMPDGPGALYGLAFKSATATHTGVNLGKVDAGAFGGCFSMNWCLCCAGGQAGGKEVSVSSGTLSLLVYTYVPSLFLMLGIHCFPWLVGVAFM